MKVGLAAQVLRRPVSKVLLVYGPPDSAEIARVGSLIDLFLAL